MVYIGLLCTLKNEILYAEVFIERKTYMQYDTRKTYEQNF